MLPSEKPFFLSSIFSSISELCIPFAIGRAISFDIFKVELIHFNKSDPLKQFE